MVSSNEILKLDFDLDVFWESVKRKDEITIKQPPFAFDNEIIQQLKNNYSELVFNNPRFHRVVENDLVVYKNKIWLVKERSKNIIALWSINEGKEIIQAIEHPIPLLFLNKFNDLKIGDICRIPELGDVEIHNLQNDDILVKVIYSKHLKVIKHPKQNLDDQFLILSSITASSLNELIDNAYFEYQSILRDIWNESFAFANNKNNFNNTIDSLKESFENAEFGAFEQTINLYLSNPSKPIINYYVSSDINYQQDSKILLIEYCFKYEDVSHDFNNKKDRMLYEDIIYQITLKIISNLFLLDEANFIETIIFNGQIKNINKATGHSENNCVLSLLVNRKTFLSINLSNVDAKTCFKSLKGISSPNLNNVTPITPILTIDKNDSRFISPTDIINNLDTALNLAAMDWEDFEMLVREVFEKEFSYNGGEVKVTRSSRDGGVDAIAFDPDPIRGGKIVIQAKRYTNTVEVSAVRDLYGTMIHEGASKGILVTTADYGKDAYEFALGKPITLLNGGHLLYYLEKHGHKARIDLLEAKKILKEEKEFFNDANHKGET